MRFVDSLLTRALGRSPAPRQTIQFAGIEWGDSRSTAENKLRISGFTPDGKPGEDITFHGRVGGYEGEGYVYLAKGRAVKAMFVFSPAPEQLLATYERLRTLLTRQYGKTRFVVESFHEPYEQGDGREVEALASGKAVIASAWRDGPDTGNLQGTDPGAILRVGRDLTVKLSYEGPGWHAEFERRQRG